MLQPQWTIRKNNAPQFRRVNFTKAIVKLPDTRAGQRTLFLRLADRFQPAVAKKFKEAVAQIKSSSTLKQLATAIENGDLSAAYRLSGVKELETSLGPVTDKFNDMYIAAGIGTVNEAVQASKIFNVRFDGFNTRAAELMSQNNMKFITAITEGQKTVINNILQQTVNSGKPPMIAAKLIRDHIGLNTMQSRALTNFRSMLENGDYLTASTRNVGGAVERSLSAAAAGRVDVTPDRVNAMVDRYAQRLLDQRADTIAQNETFKVLNQGSKMAWEQMIDGNPEINRYEVKRYWVATDDERTRPDHAELPVINAEGVGMDEPFILPDGSPIMEPYDPAADPSETINCRCTLVYRLNEIDESLLPPIEQGRSILPEGE